MEIMRPIPDDLERAIEVIASTLSHLEAPNAPRLHSPCCIQESGLEEASIIGIIFSIERLGAYLREHKVVVAFLEYRFKTEALAMRDIYRGFAAGQRG